MIPGAVAAADLEAMKGDFPKSKTAPVIVYGPGAAQAFATVRGWKYKNATILAGGIDQWTGAGQSLAELDTLPASWQSAAVELAIVATQPIDRLVSPPPVAAPPLVLRL